MNQFSLFFPTTSKRVTLRGGDIDVTKLCRIFQIESDTIYVTDSHNVAIFPDAEGTIDAFEATGNLLEVHGEVVKQAPPTAQGHSVTLNQSQTPPAFSFRTPTAKSHTPTSKSYIRQIHIAELENGGLVSNDCVTVKYTEQDASVSSFAEKVAEVLEGGEYILTDSKGVKIHDSAATRGVAFWKQNARKILAVRDDEYLRYVNGAKKLKKRRSEVDESAIEHVEELREVVDTLVGKLPDLRRVQSLVQSLASPGQEKVMMLLDQQEKRTLLDALTCIICKGKMVDPQFFVCCKSILGCATCMAEWSANATTCPKCRASLTAQSQFDVRGVEEASKVVAALSGE